MCTQQSVVGRTWDLQFFTQGYSWDLIFTLARTGHSWDYVFTLVYSPYIS